MKETVIHMTLHGESLAATVAYRDVDDAEVTGITITGDGGQLLKPKVLDQMYDQVFAALPDVIAEERAEAEWDRRLEDGLRMVEYQARVLNAVQAALTPTISETEAKGE